MIDAISGAIAGLRAAVDMTKVAVDTRDAIKIGEAKSALIERLLDVQNACLALQESNAALVQDKHLLAQEKRELEAQIVQMRDQANRLAQYERMHTPAGSIVFVDKTTKGSPDGAVYACASCMDEGKVSTLQPIFRGNQLTCPVHGTFGLNTEPQRGPMGMLFPKK